MDADLGTAAGLRLAAYRDEHVAERVRRALAREHVADERSSRRCATTLPSEPDSGARWPCP